MSRSLFVLALMVMGHRANAAPLSEAEAVSRALGNESFAARLNAEKATADARATGAGAWENPQVDWSREQLTTSSASEDVLLLSQQLELSGRLGLEGDAADNDAQVVGHRQRQVRARRVATTRLAFYAVLFAQQRRDILHQWRQQLAELSRAVRARSDAGDAAEYEARRLESQLARVDASLVIAATQRESAWTELVILMGHADDRVKSWPRATGSLTPEATSHPPTQDVAGRGDVAALESEHAAATIRSRAAGRWWVPRLTLHGGYKGVRDSATDEHGVVLGVGVELPILDRAQGQDEAQAAIARAAAARMASLTWAATQRIRQRQLAATELLAAAKVVQAGVAIGAVDLARTAQASYLAGELSIVELLDAHHNALESKLELLELQLRARTAVIELERELGVIP